MDKDDQDENRSHKPHPDGTLLSIFWPDHGLATVEKCPITHHSGSESQPDGMSVYACIACKQLRGFFSPGRSFSALPMDISGHTRVLFTQVICAHPAVRRKDEEKEE